MGKTTRRSASRSTLVPERLLVLAAPRRVLLLALGVLALARLGVRLLAERLLAARLLVAFLELPATP